MKSLPMKIIAIVASSVVLLAGAPANALTASQLNEANNCENNSHFDFGWTAGNDTPRKVYDPGFEVCYKLAPLLDAMMKADEAEGEREADRQSIDSVNGVARQLGVRP
jgi:hypothetical protein